MIHPARHFRLSVSIGLLGIGSVIVTAMVLMAVAVWQSGQYNRLAQQEVDQLIAADLDHITQGAYNLVRTEDEAVQQQVSSNLDVARHVLQSAGGVRLARETVAWTAVNQYTGRRVGLSLPKMLVGRQWLGQNDLIGLASPLVDDVAELTGEDATVFQRLNDAGDMIRVATTVVDDSGRRAVGTYIPAVNPDGKANPVVQAVLSGRSYHGRAYVVNEWYLTAYEPLTDSNGRLVGMLYVGLRQKKVESRIRQAILQTRVGKTGYIYVIGGQGQQRGQYIISQFGERDGEYIWDSRDSEGRFVIREIVERAVGLKPGEMTTVVYDWLNPGEAEARRKIARLAYYEPWDWVIGTSVYLDELQTYRAVLQRGRRRMVHFMLAAGLLLFLIMGLIAVLYTWTIIRPLRRLQQAVEVINDGNLNHMFHLPVRNEIGALADAFNLMRERLAVTVRGLRESEEKYRKIFDNAVEGMFQSIPAGRFLSGNPAIARMLGYDSPQDLIDSVGDIARQVYSSSRDREDVLRELRENGQVVGRELELLCKNGQKIWVEMSCRLVGDTAGGDPLIEGFIMDISGRKKLEEQLRQSQKMEALGTLTGGIAHDFNNILTAIIGYGEFIRRQLDPDSPLRRHADEILTAADKASHLTRSLLAFSRKQPMHLRPVELNEVIGRIDKLLIRIIGEDIEYRSDLAQEALTVMADKGQLEQVLMNLAANARDAMPDGGTLTVKTQRLSAEQAGPDLMLPVGEYALLSVSDTGTGMSEQVRQRIFEPFYTTKETGKGTGLGLSIVYGIVQQHKGHIVVHSAPGRGSSFQIYLALSERLSESNELARTMALQRGSETILLAEDDPSVRELFKCVLQESGYTVIEAVNGEDALRKYLDNQAAVQFLLFDVIMPKKNGKEAYDEIKKMNPAIRVLFSSGYTSDIIYRQGILDEGIDLIMKPVMPDALLSKIREILDRK